MEEMVVATTVGWGTARTTGDRVRSARIGLTTAAWHTRQGPERSPANPNLLDLTALDQTGRPCRLYGNELEFPSHTEPPYEQRKNQC